MMKDFFIFLFFSLLGLLSVWFLGATAAAITMWDLSYYNPAMWHPVFRAAAAIGTVLLTTGLIGEAVDYIKRNHQLEKEKRRADWLEALAESRLSEIQALRMERGVKRACAYRR